MRPDLLYVVTAYSNPMMWESRERLYRDFEKHMHESGVNLTTIECSYGERPHILDNPNTNHIKVRAETTAWNKECLLNLGIQRLPDAAKYVAWIDGDIKFRNLDWAAKTVHALQLYDILQPWEFCYDLGPNDELMQTHASYCRQHALGEPLKQPEAYGGVKFPHPGFAWASKRNLLSKVGGLFEHGGMGSGDHHMAHCLNGNVEVSLPRTASESYQNLLFQWQERALKTFNKNIGYLPINIEHNFHGRKHERKYISRWEMFIKNEFDPFTDLIKNSYGVLEFSGNKPELIREWNAYLLSRREDINSLD